MAFDAFTGPLPLTRGAIARAVPRHAPGVFAVGQLTMRGAFGVVTRIGRADRDLVDGLTQFEGRYDAFLFAVTSSPRRAFELECALYHRLRRPDLPHPAASPGARWTCAICHFNARRPLLIETAQTIQSRTTSSLETSPDPDVHASRRGG